MISILYEKDLLRWPSLRLVLDNLPINNRSINVDVLFQAAFETAEIELLVYLYSLDRYDKIRRPSAAMIQIIFLEATRKKLWNVIHRFAQSKQQIDHVLLDEALKHSALKGDLKAVEQLWNVYLISDTYDFKIHAIKEALNAAVTKGYLDVVQYLITTGPYCELRSILNKAIEHGHLNILEWLWEKEGVLTRYYLPPQTLKKAVENKHWDVVTFLSTASYPSGDALFTGSELKLLNEVAKNFAAKGDLKAIEQLYSLKLFLNPPPVDFAPKKSKETDLTSQRNSYLEVAHQLSIKPEPALIKKLDENPVSTLSAQNALLWDRNLKLTAGGGIACR